MNFSLSKVYTKNKSLLWSLLFLTLYSTTLVFAAPPTSPYTPIDNITDPTCAPTDTNCFVSVFPDQDTNDGKLLFTDGTNPAWASNLYWDETNDRLGVGDSTPSAPLDIAGQYGGYARFMRVATNVERIEFVTNNSGLTNTASMFVNPDSGNYFETVIGGNTDYFNQDGGTTMYSDIGISLFGDLLLSGTNNITSTYTAVTMRDNFFPVGGTATFTSQLIDPTINQTGGATGTIRGIYYNPTLTSLGGVHTAFESTSGKIVFTDSQTGAVSYTGINHTVGTTSNSTIAAFRGFNGEYDLAGTGQANNIIGHSIRIDSTNSNTANILTAIAGRVKATSSGAATAVASVAGYLEWEGSGTLTNYYGFTVGESPNFISRFINNAGGTITNTYGIYIGDVTAGTQTNQAYGLYQEDINARNFFGGSFGIGDSTPDYKLDVETDAVSSYATSLFNDGNNDNRYGLLIQAGADTPSANRWIQFNDGDGTDQGSVCYTGGQANICAPSDIRLKQNIQNTTLSLSTLNSIQVKDFTYISDATNTTIHGFIAQELKDVYPSAVSVPQDPNEYWKVSYNQLTPLIVKAIQDLDVKIEDLSIITEADTNRASLIRDFFRDVAVSVENGIAYIKSIRSDRVETKQLCVEDVCITRDQFLQMTQNYGSPQGGGSVENEEENTPSDEEENPPVIEEEQDSGEESPDSEPSETEESGE